MQQIQYQFLHTLPNQNQSKIQNPIKNEHPLLNPTQQQHLNTRIKNLKTKYITSPFTQNSQKLSPSDLQSTFTTTLHNNKQNQSYFLNCSLSNNLSITGPKFKYFQQENCRKDKYINKFLYQQKKLNNIKDLEQINCKIVSLIQNIKNQQQLNKSIIIPKLPLPTNPNINKPPKKYHNLLTTSNNSLFSNIQTIQSKRTKSKRPESLDILTTHHRIKSRQNGKILSRNKSTIKSMKLLKQFNNKLLHDQTNELVKQLCQQIIVDQQYMKFKTQAIKLGSKFKNMLIATLEKSELSPQSQQLILDWNFDQMDPLFTQRYQNQSNIQDLNLLISLLIQSLIKCQKQWNRILSRKFKKQRLNLHDLDHGKGYFLKEDLTSFIAIKSQIPYCNRAISLIFKRINRNKGKIVSINDLYDILCI